MIFFFKSEVYFFFCKQKTAYEMRISDWSSDVCSSDLNLRVEKQVEEERRHQVVAMVAQCDLVESLLFGERVQRAAAQARAQRAHGLAFRHHARDHRVGVLLEDPVFDAERFQVLRQHVFREAGLLRSEEHTSELQSLMRN